MLLDDLKAVREQVRASAVKELPVPPGKHWVRFRPPTSQEARDRLTGIVAAYRVGSAMSADQELQLIVDCCDEILVSNGGEGLSPIDQNEGPLRFDASDERWGDDVKTARDCVRALYNIDLQPLATSGTADALIDWLQGLDAEIATRAEGKSESSATP